MNVTLLFLLVIACKVQDVHEPVGEQSENIINLVLGM